MPDNNKTQQCQLCKDWIDHSFLFPGLVWSGLLQHMCLLFFSVIHCFLCSEMASLRWVKRFTRNQPASIHEVFYFHSRRLDRLQTTVQQAAECTVWRQISATDAASDAIFPLHPKVFRVREFFIFPSLVAWKWSPHCGLKSFHLWWLLYLGMVDPFKVFLFINISRLLVTSHTINVFAVTIY